jgi:transposase-like protein
MDVPVRASRREHFSAAQRWELLIEFDKCTDRGAKAAFFSRIQVDPTTVYAWARARAQGRLVDPGLVVQAVRGRKQMSSEERAELARLRAENEVLKDQLATSQEAVEILGKASALLEAAAKSARARTRAPEPAPEPETGWPQWLKPSTGERPSPRSQP